MERRAPAAPFPETEDLPSDVRKVIVGEEEVMRGWSSGLDQENPHIKKEELWSGQEGEQLQQEEVPFTAVPVKSEDEEEKLQSSQLHHGQSEENVKAKPPTSSSSQHMKAEAEGDDAGEPEPAGSFETDQPTSWSSESEMKNQTSCCPGPEKYQRTSCSPEPVMENRSSSSTDSDNEDDEDWVRPAQADPKAAGRAQMLEKSTTCSECGKTYSSRSSLNWHKRIHSGEKRFTCSVCSSSFTQRYTLILHMRRHTGEKPYLCSTCGVRFSQSSALKKHTRVHAPEKSGRRSASAVPSGQLRPDRRAGESSPVPRDPSRSDAPSKGSFSCSECRKTFSLKSNLKKHMMIHTGEKPFSCLFCDFTCTRRHTLVQHMRTHTGEKPFNCSVCEKCFTQSTNLRKHMRLHTGEKPFSCTSCGRIFSWKYQIKRHKCANVAGLTSDL